MKKASWSMRTAGPIALALAVFLAIPSGDLYPKNRGRGADLVVQKKDGTFFRGVLLSVQKRTLILFDEDSGADLTISIDEIDALKVVKEPRFSSRFSWTALLVGTSASVYGLSYWSRSLFTRLGLGVGGGAVAVMGLLSLIKGTDEIAVLKGASEKRTIFALEKLSGMASFSGPLPADLDAIRKSFRPRSSPSGKGRPFRDLTGARPPRFHISFEPFYLLSEGEGPYMSLFRTMKFADTDPGGSIWGFDIPAVSYPYEHGLGGISLRSARMEYSISRSFSAGIAYASMGDGSSEGYRLIPVTWRGEPYSSEVHISEERSGHGYFFTAAWMPVPETFFGRTSFKVGVELGVCVSRHHFATSESFPEVDARSFSRTVPAAGVFGQVDFYSGRIMSLGLRAGYRYARARIGAFDLKGTYMMFEESGSDGFDIIHLPLDISFPAHAVELGGPTLGISLGFHF